LTEKKRKVCPLMRAIYLTTDLHVDVQHCLGEDCALWVKLVKTSTLGLGKLVYEGCGLVNTIPWKYVRREEAEKDES